VLINHSDLSAADTKRKTIFYAKTDVADLGDICTHLKQTRADESSRYHALVTHLAQNRFGLRNFSVSPLLHAGTFRLLYQVEHSSGEPLVVRVNRIPEYSRAWDFLIDAHIYPLLRTHGLSAPTVIDVDVSRRTFATDYQVMTKVEGKNLKAFEDAETQYMSPVLLRSVGKYLARVHSINGDGFGPISVALLSGSSAHLQGLHASWADYIMTRFDEHVAVCQKIHAITSAQAAQILEIFGNYHHLFCDAPQSLLHGDVGNQNFLSDDGERITALVDWEDAMVGDPVFDIALWGTFFRDAMLATFLEGYTTVRSLPADFERRYWIYYLRSALSKTVHRFRFGYTDHPGRPPASLRIQKALSKIIAFSSFSSS
jgi:aminoglycoside phosphotransferase (APT) family kinase protein